MSSKATTKKFDENVYGPEPEIVEDIVYSSSDMMGFYNWYNYMHDIKDAHKFLVDYMKQFDPTKANLIQSIPLHKVSTTSAWIARMTMRGLKMSQSQKHFFKESVDKMLTFSSAEENVVAELPTKTIAQRTEEKSQELSGHIAGMIDDFIMNKFEFKGDILKALNDLGVKGAHCKTISAALNPQLKELNHVLDKYKLKDDTIVEGYITYSKRDIKRLRDFIQSLSNAMDTITDSSNRSKKTRSKKVKSPKQQVNKLKYMKEYEPLKLKSVSPEKLIGAKVAFVFNTSNSQLSMYMANDVDGFTVERSMIRGFKASSSSKRFARNIKVLERLLSYNKADAINAFEVAKGSTKPATGRLNDKMIIMKVY